MKPAAVTDEAEVMEPLGPVSVSGALLRSAPPLKFWSTVQVWDSPRFRATTPVLDIVASPDIGCG